MVRFLRDSSLWTPSPVYSHKGCRGVNPVMSTPLRHVLGREPLAMSLLFPQSQAYNQCSALFFKTVNLPNLRPDKSISFINESTTCNGFKWDEFVESVDNG